jgi:hypothetical protein
VIETLNISIYKSSNQDAFIRYNEAYSKIIDEFGENYNAFVDNWYMRPNTYCSLVSDSENEVIGGFRLQVHQPNYKLPIQKHSIKYQSSVANFIEKQNHFELCESSGFFVNSKYRKSIISYEIVRSFFVLVLLLNIKTMVGISLDKTLNIFAHFNIAVSKKIMSPDNHFLFANNPKSLVFELNNLTNQIRRNIETREEFDRLLEMVKQKKTSYQLSYNQQEYHINFTNNIDSSISIGNKA